MKPLKFHPSAEDELFDSVDFYNHRVPGLGEDFFSIVEEACKEIQKDPVRRPLRHDGTRKVNVQRFPYALVYRDDAAQILIIAVAHGARRPGYWRSRL
jgi:plasmid stabilization system protein ParE